MEKQLPDRIYIIDPMPYVSAQAVADALAALREELITEMNDLRCHGEYRRGNGNAANRLDATITALNLPAPTKAAEVKQ